MRYIYVLYNACIKFLYLCVYVCIDLFICGFVWTATHEITARNGADSKHNAHDNENHVRNWHPFFTLWCVFIFHNMDLIASALCCASFVVSFVFVCASFFKPRLWI
jgi:hypothetical protein